MWFTEGMAIVHFKNVLSISENRFSKAFQHIHIQSITIPLTPDIHKTVCLKENVLHYKKETRKNKEKGTTHVSLLYLFIFANRN